MPYLNFIALYIETFCHREHWVRLYVTFDIARQASTSLLLNLLPRERNFIQSKLEDQNLHPFTFHPLFVPVIVIDLLFYEVLDQLHQAFSKSVNTYIDADLYDSQTYKHLKKEDLDIEEASDKSLQHEQNILVLFEKIENAIKIAAKLISWFESFDTTSMSEYQRKQFLSTGSILQDRLEYVLDVLDLQLVRLKRTHGHAQLNRLGVQIPVLCLVYTGRTPKN
jgi:hypothetical protein